MTVVALDPPLSEFDCDRCDVRVIQCVPYRWSVLRKQYRATGVDVEKPTCAGCVIALVIETPQHIKVEVKFE